MKSILSMLQIQYLEDYIDILIKCQNQRLVTSSGIEFTYEVNSKYGDDRIYITHKNKKQICIFMPDVEKFIDCFPYCDHKPTLKEMHSFFSITEPVGTMLPSDLMIKENTNFIDYMYSIFCSPKMLSHYYKNCI
ncbi:MAG: hypothetical protein ACI4WH_06365 [Oscillospiraceae bacterium]